MENIKHCLRYIIYGDSFMHNNNDSSKLRNPEKRPLHSIMFRVMFIKHHDMKKRKTCLKWDKMKYLI